MYHHSLLFHEPEMKLSANTFFLMHFGAKNYPRFAPNISKNGENLGCSKMVINDNYFIKSYVVAI